MSYVHACTCSVHHAPTPAYSTFQFTEVLQEGHFTRPSGKSLCPLPFGPTIRSLLLLDDDLDLDEYVGWHGRDRALLLDECAGRHRRDRVLLLEDGAGPHGRKRALPLRHCRPSRRRPPLRRSRDAQRRLLGGGEAAQVHWLATALHLRQKGLGPARLVGHAEVARRVRGHH
eukprot:scaffold30502_cov63-Phaeocystis_antarctica.AAC.2